jgi:hypothetical protein
MAAFTVSTTLEEAVYFSCVGYKVLALKIANYSGMSRNCRMHVAFYMEVLTSV